MYTVSAATVLVIYVATILENIIVVCGAVHHSVEFSVLIVSGKNEIRKIEIKKFEFRKLLKSS